MPVLKSKMGDMGREKKTTGLYHVLAGSADFLLELFRACPGVQVSLGDLELVWEV